MQFEYDPERLIEEVRKRPGIWDYEDIDYRTKNTRLKMWNEVVAELMETNPDVKVSKSEMRELEIQLQKKWKSIRDSFQKYIAKPNRTSRPYIYSKQLQFLLKDQSLPQREDVSASSESDYAPKRKKSTWRSKKKLKLVKEEDQTSEDDNVQSGNNDDSIDYSNDAVEITVPSAKESKLNNSHTDEFAFANVDAQAKGDNDDPDRLFLLSLLPHLKTIPEEFRLNVKMELMQVLRSANYSTAKQHKII